MDNLQEYWDHVRAFARGLANMYDVPGPGQTSHLEEVQGWPDYYEPSSHDPIVTPPQVIMDPAYERYLSVRQRPERSERFRRSKTQTFRHDFATPWSYEEVMAIPQQRRGLGINRDFDPSEGRLPEVEWSGDRDVYTQYPIQGAAAWDQYYKTWDAIGAQIDAELPDNEPMIAEQLQFMADHGFYGWSFIAKGGHGKVFKVTASKLIFENRAYKTVDLVCKILSLKRFKNQTTPTLSDTQAIQRAIEQMLREQDLHSQLIHENIVKSEGVFHVEDTVTGFPSVLICHFMELCLTDLTSVIDGSPNGRMTEAQAFQWFVQVCKGLNYLHSRGCVHCDIKPQNILMKKENNQIVFKLGDFSLAQMFSAGYLATTRTRIGTPKYQSPEMFNIEQTYLHTVDLRAADVFSLGITLAESIVGTGRWTTGLQTHNLFTIQCLLYAARNWNQQWAQFYGISKQLADLLSAMTEPVPTYRINIQRVLNHDWIQKIDVSGIQLD